MRIGQAEVAGEHVAQPVPVAHHQGLVQAQLVVEPGHGVVGCARPQDGERRVAGEEVQQEEREGRDGEQHRHELEELAGYEPHASATPHAPGRYLCSYPTHTWAVKNAPGTMLTIR